MNDDAYLEVTGVTKWFGSARRRHTAVDGLDLVVDRTSRTGVVGESGSGKSTLSRLLIGLEHPSAGTVTYNGVPLQRMLRSRTGRTTFRRAVQFVGQDTTSSFDPRRRLLDSCTRPLRDLHELGRAEAEAAALETIVSLGLPEELAHRHPSQVSGGQRQRFALARCLAVRPQILICDEVVSALDVSVQGAILNLLKRYCAEHSAGLFFVSHGLPATAFVADRIVVMHRGAIVEQGTVDEVLDHAQHPYTRSLLEAHEVGSALRAAS
ncbi:ABC transporter ATP-binding protein [Pseudonocardia sp. WMMC193]|uniref:ABC transporter ATP-binding protein n=1 Tax=Pseudonocardia sp. WMMC193 TaxID=2911965 RepID=UPI001F0048C4|nr:ATP-binding cassette domain-containing protein [Pseudonocardia sp. WMMC193]MCF7550457.1 ATP-binding cassette domain-containing protein [Pseudonocardia sp. WMMC193]